jgi:DNA ligase-1
MKFSELSNYFKQIEETPSRNKMMEILSKLLAKASVKEVDKLVYLSLGRLAPKFNNIEFNLADKMVAKSLAYSFDKSVPVITTLYKKSGDLGEVVQQLNNKQTSNLSVLEVFGKLKQIAIDSGQGSQERKIIQLSALIQSLDPLSSRYVIRTVLGKLRLGFSDKTILDSLSWMRRKSKAGRAQLDTAYQVHPDVGTIAKLVKQTGISSIPSKVKVELGTPVIPALAQRLKTSKEMIKKMGIVIAEPKFDGTRVQIHWSKEDKTKAKDDTLFASQTESKQYLKTFTRNLDENSHMFPELKKLGDQVKGENIILDSEAIGYDPKTGTLLPFQMTITRKRKHGIDKAQTSVPLKFYVFDVLYKDGKNLINLPLIDRRKILENTIIKKKDGVLLIDDYITTNDPLVLKQYHKQQLDQGLEGAMVKKRNGQYRPGRTGFNWVKFKESEDSQGKLSDTLDCVVMGYYKGKGKRANFGIGAFLVGVKNKDQFLTIAKIGTGLSDEQWKEMKQKCSKNKTRQMPKEYSQIEKILTPDEWVSPKIVVEIAADEITKSPTHSAGLALRFPRLVRFREDKDPTQATALKELQNIF